MDQITPEEWEAAKRHFDEVFEGYKNLLGRPGVNTEAAALYTWDRGWQEIARWQYGRKRNDIYCDAYYWLNGE